MAKKITYINEIYTSLQNMHCPAVPEDIQTFG